MKYKVKATLEIECNNCDNEEEACALLEETLHTIFAEEENVTNGFFVVVTEMDDDE